MGQGSSKDAEFAASLERSKKLEAINKQTFKQEQQKIKLLLLGAGESGKSTIFKQMEILYGQSYPESERALMVSVVHSNILSNIRALVHACAKFTPLANPSLADEFAKVPESEDTVLDTTVGALVKKIWADSGAQQTWGVKSNFQIQDALSWYMKDIDRISATGYIPSVDDILHARVRTSGIVEKQYKIDKVEFAMYDVGGQRNERKKWIHLFDNVTAVIFVAAISEYDQCLYEDENMYRMDEALLLFDEVCSTFVLQKHKNLKKKN
jgi:GTPase SAR1 family protein